MKIKKSWMDTSLLLLLMFVAILPTLVAKPMVIIFVGLLSIRILLDRNIFIFGKTKTIIFILFVPGIVLSIFDAPEHTVRFVGILLLVVGFPFSNFEIKINLVRKLSILILLYLIITQILLALGNETILNFREFGYANEWSYVFNYGDTTGAIIYETLSQRGNFRAGGLYHNPNDMAGVILLFFFIYDISTRYLNQTNMNYKINRYKNLFSVSIFSLVLIGILLTKSRTLTIAFLLYILIQNTNLTELIRLRFKKKFFVIITLVTGILYLNFERIMSGVLEKGGSANIKFRILASYIREENYFKLLFGGTFDKHFDAELGYWLGAAGAMSIISFFIFYRLVYQVVPEAKALIFSFILISFGITLFYHLLFTSILIPLLITTFSLYSKKSMNK